eukprot:CAMPEP_0202904742 /NCGR_PEP_ID=MMETSP1392-20130828/30911_1 /ASSEMBLY_ACC=CAM_ASM_000868 /TAXON_ID=225041 /ORGANISM="Chlamydomonas chlamydogama, Strain SAG 11-48b" /LENGTH=430 /DNA_ID=CAMNT_0049592531 /DNA_START=222 /DNA_END=1514 /DNA_ORIENTATION=-
MPVISWEELARHNTSESLYVVIEGKAYDVTHWIKDHPGGELVLKHMAGRDATDAFLAFHRPHVRAYLSKYFLGNMETSAKHAPSQATVRFRQLAQSLEKQGFYKTSYAYYLGFMAWLILLLSAAFYMAAYGCTLPAAVTVALFWQQVAFIGHDAGHHAITHQRHKDNVLGLVINAFVGIGLSWWNNTHNVHHTVPNSADCDADIQFMPLIANSPLYFNSLFSKYHDHELTFDETARRLISYQHLSFLPLLMIARYGLYLQSLKQVLGGRVYVHRWLELGAQLFFFAWYGLLVSLLPSVGDRVLFVLASHAAFSILHLQICLSHFTCHVYEGLPPENEWMATQLSGTMNWSCPTWLDWFHGGLQFQIEHHLFPRLPRHHLRKVSEMVRPLCQELGLRYHSPPFGAAIVELLSSLKTTAMRARDMGSKVAPL